MAGKRMTAVSSCHHSSVKPTGDNKKICATKLSDRSCLARIMLRFDDAVFQRRVDGGMEDYLNYMDYSPKYTFRLEASARGSAL
jgi:hypothetical protein